MSDEQVYNHGHQVEGLDRCHIIMSMIDEFLVDHPAVLKAGVNQHAHDAAELIMEAYQAIGRLDEDDV